MEEKKSMRIEQIIYELLGKIMDKLDFGVTISDPNLDDTH